MRRALVDLTDPLPTPSEQDLLREHFQHRCAYCDSPALPRVGHIDHADNRDGNHLGNLILACGTCNGDEKLDTHWNEFLGKKCGADNAIFEQRKQRIQSWMDAHPRPPKLNTPEVDEAVRSAEQAIGSFAVAYERVRAAVAAAKKAPQ